jgi:glycosyltransferase involved in cell wall biosynthesis
MKVLLIHQAFASPDEPGGTRHYELARHAVQQGIDFTIVASDLSYLTGKRTVARKGGVIEQDLNGVRVIRVYIYPALHRSFFWRVVSFLSFMLTSVKAALQAGPVDLVMGTSPPIFQAVSAWIVAAIRRRPFLLEIRDLWPEFAIDIGVLRSPILIRLSRWLERFLYARATHLLINSPAYRDYLVNKGVPESKITLIPNGVDPDMFDPDAKGERIRREFNLNGQFVVAYAGALGLANDITTILKAADRLRDESDVHFLLIGDGKERANLESLARQLHLSNVIFAGSRPKAEMSEILAASDVCIATLKNIPMFRTTYPNKVFDYMAAGRPTILAIDGVIRQVVESAGAGIFVPPGDDAALAEATRRLYHDHSEAQLMRKSARAYVVKHFNRQEQAQEFVELAKRLALRK